ncbi:hypothetical protein Ccrd_014348 [Cynara cardunculus var. scolymus]|uniref:Transmembrane protein n=1 Tax=Cynara cardunculus var. scolymus TaxID=59895 RepID=A0A124SGS5_CYNCS|nr:hypothetical protein Ccrd_014348 [Cynara cardunculus var. scolymus]
MDRKLVGLLCFIVLILNFLVIGAEKSTTITSQVHVALRSRKILHYPRYGPGRDFGLSSVPPPDFILYGH